MKKMLGIMLVGLMAVGLAACGGGGSAGGGGDDGGDVITKLADVPDEVINPQDYDLTTKAVSADVAVHPKMPVLGGGFSRAGCETNNMKKNIIRNAMMPRMVICYMKGIEAAMGQTAAGNGEFNYWRGDEEMAQYIEGPSELGGNWDPRMAIKVEDNKLTFVMCNGTEKSMELYVDGSNGAFAGHAIDKWAEERASKLEFNADGTPEDFTTAIFSQSHIEPTQFGSNTLEATPTSNVVHGFYNNSGEWSFAGAVYAQFNEEEGSAKFRADAGSYPAPTIQQTYDQCSQMNGGEGSCGDLETNWLSPTGWLATNCSLNGLTAESQVCFQKEGCPEEAVEGMCSIETGEGNTESFTIDRTDPLNLLFTRAVSSVFLSAVTAAELEDSLTQPTIEFTEISADIDCSQSATWTVMEFSSAPDVADCVAMEAEMNNWRNDEQACAEQEAASEGPQD